MWENNWELHSIASTVTSIINHLAAPCQFSSTCVKLQTRKQSHCNGDEKGILQRYEKGR